MFVLAHSTALSIPELFGLAALAVALLVRT